MDNSQNRQNQNPMQNQNSKDFKITGNWDEQSSDLKEKYAQLTDEDLEFEPGKEDELISRVETRLNKDREEVINILRKGQPHTV